MEPIIIVLLIVVVAVVLYFVWDGREARKDHNARLDGQRTELLERLEAQRTELATGLEGVNKTVHESLSDSKGTVEKVNERLSGIDVAAKRILDEVAPSIGALEDVLRPPKMRGGFGETLLAQLLANALPQQHYSMQYSFRSGPIVDAVVRMKQGLVPVDSKFPLDGFERMHKAVSDDERDRERRGFIQAVKKHVDSVTKYILQDEGTLPFVVMYIPSEAVFYEVIVREELATPSGTTLAEYARDKNVLVASPGTFYNLLQTVALGLRGLEVEGKAREIIDHLGSLQGEFQKVQQDFNTLGRHMEHAKSKYEEVNRRFDRFDVRLNRPLDDGNQAQLHDPAAAETTIEQQALPSPEPEESAIPGALRADGSEDS